ncbi:MAG: GIY-YIG nuclease family protein [Clostridia bacterium]|nr:GIY-YIG nuclease family protein [Clostridia bacterium]
MNYEQLKAIKEKKKENEKKILEVCPNCPNRSGIYFLIREEDGFKWAYIGQAKSLLSRLAGHLKGYQHIDLSLKKHGLYSTENPTGWRVGFMEYPEKVLDEKEQYWIKRYANAGYQLRNHESGGKQGKFALEGRKPSRNYYDGLEQGRKNARRFIADLFSKHLDYVPKKQPPTKLQEKALQKFKDFLEHDDE